MKISLPFCSSSFCLGVFKAWLGSRKASGTLMDEETLLKKFSPDRAKQIKRYCLANALWEFDMYESDKVLYNVVEVQSFESLRRALS